MKIWTSLSLLLRSSTLALASSQTLVVHEKREFDLPSMYAGERHRIEPDALLPMRVALKQNQRALDHAESWLMDVSDPDSANYGRHWSQGDVVDAFQPSSETLDAVTGWLRSHGIVDFTHSDNKLWIAFDVTARKAEEMLRTEYLEHEVKSEKGQTVGFEASCDQYHLPENLKEHVDLIKPGIQSSDVTGRTLRSRKYLEALTTSHSETRRFYCPVGGGVGGIPGGVPGHGVRDNGTTPNCRELVTPACVQALYDIPLANPETEVSPSNSLGVFEAADYLYYQGSLDLFYERYTDIPAGSSPIFQDIDGAPYPPNSTHGKDWKLVTGEGNANLDAAMPIIYPQNATVFQIGGNKFFSKFLDAIDGSFCTPSERRNSTLGGKPQCGIFKPTNVITASYSDDEQSISPSSLRRMCMEYLKLGLQGVSVFISSGDLGVGYLGGATSEKKECSGQFGPGFPPSCPWITAVGATQIARNGTVRTAEVAATGTYDGGPGDAWSSGGGFSTHFGRPKYQDTAVLQYFNTSPPPWPYFEDGQYKNSTGRYNRNGRGYPDISANGKKVALCGINLCKQLNCSYNGGTSLSTPFVAAMINRVVEERIRVGKSPVGFVNPTLYKHPEMFNDIVSGGNGYCTADGGFESVPGWDPVTGMGTPNYPKLLDVFLKLP